MVRLLIRLLFALIIFFALNLLSAQDSRLSPQQFTPSGDTYLTGNNCYRLTEDHNWAGGSLWYRTPISLAAPFTMELELFFGCKDEDGADGIVFVFHPEPRQNGFRGEGMGFAGLVPSLGIEIDTWQNHHLFDPSYDHIAILRDGIIQHDYSLYGPVRIPNVEDCGKHELKVSWLPASNKLTVALDGIRYVTYEGDIIRHIFRGNPNVYWGVTAATGGYNNRHEICFEKLEFEPALEPTDFEAAIQKKLLKGDILALDKVRFESGKAGLQDASRIELEKVYRFLLANPELSLNIYGHTDSTGDPFRNRELSKQRAAAIKDYLLQKGIHPDRVTTNGYGERYPIASNITLSGRELNRRVEVYFFRKIP